jgi:hypothetical protein
MSKFKQIKDILGSSKEFSLAVKAELEAWEIAETAKRHAQQCTAARATAAEKFQVLLDRAYGKDRLPTVVNQLTK